MRSNYKRIGDFIELVDERNKDLKIDLLLGLSISKEFIASVANTVGADMANYKIIRKGQFACSIMQVRRDKKMPVALLKVYDEAIISQAYPVFQISDENELHPEYLMMWFSRSEFDRHACFLAVGGVRGSLEWKDFLEMELPIPSIKKQREIVREYNTIVNRIKLNEQLNQKLEETAQTLYKHWFVDFEFPITKESCPELVSGSPELEGKPYKSCGGKMVYNEELDKEIPEGWGIGKLSDQAHIEMGQSPKGDTYNTKKQGVPLVNGPVEFGEYFTQRQKWTTSPTKLSALGDLIVCVRGSTTGRFVKSDGVYCLGRGVCSIRAKKSQRFVDLIFRSSINELLSLTTGSTFPNWDRTTLSNFPSIIPPSSIVERFENKASQIYTHVEILSMEHQSLIELRNLILAKMTKVELEKEITI
jgi:type I restriction enzyme S subunit